MSAHMNENRIQQVLIYYITQFGIPCLWRKARTACEPQRSLKCYHRQMAWRRHQTTRIRKAVGNTSRISSKGE